MDKGLELLKQFCEKNQDKGCPFGDCENTCHFRDLAPFEWDIDDIIQCITSHNEEDV